MKKTLYFLLITLSLSCFFGCGSDNNKNTNSNSQNSESELSWEEQQALEEQKLTEHWTNVLADTWHPRASDKELGDVILSKDETLSFNGETYPYKFTYVDENNFTCYAYDGDTIKYSISYQKENPSAPEFENRFEKLSIMVPEGENSYTTANGGGMFYRESSYEAIEITADNFETYFELVTVSKEVYNDFNELERIYLETFYKIKDEYNELVNINMSDVIVEVETKTCNYNYTFDIANKTYTLGNRINEREEIDTTTVEFRAGHYSSYSDISYLSIWICSGCSIGVDHDTCSSFLEEATVLRAAGTLYLLKE